MQMQCKLNYTNTNATPNSYLSSITFRGGNERIVNILKTNSSPVLFNSQIWFEVSSVKWRIFIEDAASDAFFTGPKLPIILSSLWNLEVGSDFRFWWRDFHNSGSALGPQSSIHTYFFMECCIIMWFIVRFLKKVKAILQIFFIENAILKRLSIQTGQLFATD